VVRAPRGLRRPGWDRTPSTRNPAAVEASGEVTVWAIEHASVVAATGAGRRVLTQRDETA
jgi:hypothetical protein